MPSSISSGSASEKLRRAVFAPLPSAKNAPPGTKATQRLYANDGSGSFTDVTAEAGLDASFYGMGVAVADYDNDGDSDLFFSALNANRLYRNDGGRFKDVTAAAGVAGDADRWSASAGFFDYDNDGDLDLFVCNYVVWSKAIDEEPGPRLAVRRWPGHDRRDTHVGRDLAFSTAGAQGHGGLSRAHVFDRKDEQPGLVGIAKLLQLVVPDLLAERGAAAWTDGFPQMV